MKIKESRALSFIAVTVVYILATVAGVAVYLSLDLPVWLSLLIADIVSTALTFIFSLIFSNASVYDPYWSVQPIVIGVAFAIKYSLNALGIIALVAVCFWGVRLTANWAYTFKNLTHQDWRYTMLKEKTKAFYPVINFVGIHLVPTLVVYGCVLPVVYIILLKPMLNALSVVSLSISFLAVILQGTADIQMHRFRKSGVGGFIRVGLWKHSRHPNYLGEILMWWGIALCSLFALPKMWYLIFGAVANTILFLVVSIPMADGRQSRKEGYEEYKRETRTLLPVKKFVKK